MNIAIYSRKSKFTGKGDSIDNQIELCREYVRFHFPDASSSDIVTFEDEGFSGKTLDRPQFQKLMRMQESNPFDALVVYRLDRVSRNVGDFAKLIEKLNRSGTAFVSVKEQFDTSTSMGRAMMNVSAVFAQLERETIAERVRDNMYLMAKDSCWTGGTTPFEGNSGEYLRYAHRNKKDYKPIALLTGVIYCSCGAPMRPKRYTTGGDSFSYICTQKERSRNKLCSIHNCIGKEADAAIRELILTSDADENIISRHIKKLRKSEGQIQSYREDLSRNISKSISDKQKQADNLTLSLASGNLNGAAIAYVNKSLNALLKEIEELKHKLTKSAELAASNKSSISEFSSAMEYLSTNFERIPLLDRRELIKRIIDKIVWDGERLEVFLATSTNSGREITEEVISFSSKPAPKPPDPKEIDGYYEFKLCSDLVVRAFAKSQNIGLRQLAKRCGVSYTTIKYWTSKRNSPSHVQYQSVFMDYYLNIYRKGSETQQPR